MAPDPSILPIDTLRPAFLEALEEGPVVVSAPTGSGKSTQVPRWCPRPVVVVEPRRVACRSLAARVAELEGVHLGREVGFQVRDERRAGEATEILFVTPGIALRIFDRLDRYATLVLDEFHERSLDTDLLLALLARRREQRQVDDLADPRLVVMSATLAGDRIAGHLGGRHLVGEGRTFPVETLHLPDGTLLPDVRGLERRTAKALDLLADRRGDVLVFLPGKGEIASVAAALSGRRDLEVLELHGGLSLGEQARIFAPAARRKVILATNVAETSLTIPGIGAVVDSGLVRQTRYLRGRGHLALVPVALDSADQRAGRAGRTAPGTCVRLWDVAAQLEERTPPEIHREALAPLVLSAAACGAAGSELDRLPFLDPPDERALATARRDLEALGALAPFDPADGRGGELTPRGRQLFGLPLDAALGALLAEAAQLDRTAREDPATDPAEREAARHLLEDMIDLVAALSPDRSFFRRGEGSGSGGRRDPGAPPRQDLSDRCDAVALLRAMRSGDGGGGGKHAEPGTPVPDPRVLADARSTARRLREAYGLPPANPAIERPVDRHRLALAVLAADPRRAHVARRRGRRIAWSHGGTEIDLARESLANEPPPERAPAGAPPDARRLAPRVEALVVLDSRALGMGRDARVLATAAMPVPLGWLLDAGLGRDRLAGVKVEKSRSGEPRRILSTIDRVYANKVLDAREEVPRGELAREAVARLFLDGRLFRESLEPGRERLEAARLALRLDTTGATGRTGAAGLPTNDPLALWTDEVRELFPEGVPELEDWVAERVGSLGVETGADVALLSPEDLLPPELPAPLLAELDRRFPRRIDLPDATYRLDYDLPARCVTLDQVAGGRREPPPLAFLPRFAGLGIKLRQGQTLRTLRKRG